MKVDWLLWKHTAWRVIHDLWIPAVPSLGITIYRIAHDRTDWITAGASFFTTLFFAGAYFGYVQRAKKLVIDERNHKDVVGKQDALITRLKTLTEDLSSRQEVLVTRLENLADDLAGHTTGGDGFCYVWFVRLGPSSINELCVMLSGKYSMQETTLCVSNFESLPARYEELHRTGKTEVMNAKDLCQTIGTVLPGVTYPIQCHLAFQNRSRIRLHLNWQGKNGLWYQRLQLEMVDGKWRQATFVKRNDIMLYTKADEGYPLDPDGNPVFHEYQS